MKQYIGMVEDHSGSMSHLVREAVKDINLSFENIRSAVSQHTDLHTIVSTVKCGIGNQGGVTPGQLLVSPYQLNNYTEYGYDIQGMTPLFDSVGFLIDHFEKVPDANDPNTSFLIMVVTDGQENASIKWRGILKNKLAQLQATDRWTFVFRVPIGYKSALVRLGIPEGNVLEWEQTSYGMNKSAEVTRQAFTSYYTARASGQTSTDKFYADLSNVSKAEIKQKLTNVANQVNIWTAQKTDMIKPIFESYYYGQPYKTGTVFYELIKTETVQRQKKIAIRDRITGEVYSGYGARDLLGLPSDHQIKLVPTKHSQYDIFVQSTSVNRKIPAGTKVMYANKLSA